jgi:hypothetical protein
MEEELMYKIKIDYRTGNSFGSHTETDGIEYEWENLEMAKESLERIKNHYEFYKKNDHRYTKPEGPLPIGVIWSGEFGGLLLLELISDSGKLFKYSSFWTGYFETLYSAEIVDDANDRKYKP